jgi:adsorption protein B
MVLFVSILVTVSSLDDIFIDLLSLFIKNKEQGEPPHTDNIPPIGVFVANWSEESVLRQMVEGNLARISHKSVKLYLGVYPNDEGTKKIALELEKKYPDRVVVVINSLEGPTSKGQLLNEMFNQVFTGDDPPEMVVMHDSEDVIDERTFEVYASYHKDYDFIQTPIFSLDSRHRSLVAASYMDEFAEKHTRELVVRNALGAILPSAGVGTCLSKKLIQHFISKRGSVLDNSTVTEDYILGCESTHAGFKSLYAFVRYDNDKFPIVATYEFFPKDFWASVKQKTRWTYGIIFEGYHSIGFQGSIWDHYFYLRDRKGIICNYLPAISGVLIILLLLGVFNPFGMTPLMQDWLWIAYHANFVFMIIRYSVKVFSIKEVYGYWDFIGVLTRWPVYSIINLIAVYRAWMTYVFVSGFATKQITWSKTEHEVPDNFQEAS